MKRKVTGQKGDLEWGWLSFGHPLLAETALPYFEIRAAAPGPRLAMIAGMHPNEVSSMQAALRLKGAFAGQLACGSVSIMPVLNMPGLYAHADTICPIDGKNINFSFPGRRDGTFSEVLAASILHEWSAGAEVFVDLHGGDLRDRASSGTARHSICHLHDEASCGGSASACGVKLHQNSSRLRSIATSCFGRTQSHFGCRWRMPRSLATNT